MKKSAITDKRNLTFRYILELIPEGGSLQDRAILITGCDTGFGRELAKKCAKNGFLVFAGCLTTEVCFILFLKNENKS